jgi:tetratricopeptide (TPR) repeat protein
VALGILGVSLAHSGQIDQAGQILEQLLKLSTAEYVDPYIIMQIHLALGDLDKALEFVQFAVSQAV